MFYCENCEEEIKTSEAKKGFVEFWGVELDAYICPECGEPLDTDTMQCSICERWLPEDEIYDTTEYINGGCGYCCEGCIEDADMKPI